VERGGRHEAESWHASRGPALGEGVASSKFKKRGKEGYSQKEMPSEIKAFSRTRAGGKQLSDTIVRGGEIRTGEIAEEGGPTFADMGRSCCFLAIRGEKRRFMRRLGKGRLETTHKFTCVLLTAVVDRKAIVRWGGSEAQLSGKRDQKILKKGEMG